MAQYLVLIYAPNPADSDTLSAEERDAHGRYADELIESGAMVAAFALHPVATAATSIRGDGITDGPFVDTKDTVSGVYVIEASDPDAALEVARRNPITQQGGGVEVRPVESSFIVDRAVYSPPQS
ncbi:YciI family protein [Leifsonia sp. NPDC058248]|uniref:YciI family protein n=1 Tax=Leifsonia sp. NPDC058248 TaxID=3346402 RepID=UPI0036DA2093